MQQTCQFQKVSKEARSVSACFLSYIPQAPVQGKFHNHRDGSKQSPRRPVGPDAQAVRLARSQAESPRSGANSAGRTNACANSRAGRGSLLRGIDVFIGYLHVCTVLEIKLFTV